FKRPTIRELAELIEKSSKEKYNGIKIVEKKEYYHLSPAQKRLYVLQQISPESTVYNLPILLQLEGILDKERIKETFQKLLERHESLRTSFHVIGEESVQKIHEPKHVKFEIGLIEIDEQGLRVSKVGNPAWPADMIRDFIRPFNLSLAPLLRVALLKENEKRHILMIDIHHIISDGASIGIIVKDFMDLYQKKDLPGLTVQYKDFSEWLHNEKQEESIKQQENFWLKEFAAEILPIELPTDYKRPKIQSFEGNSIRFEIDNEATNVLKKLILEVDVTMYMVLLAFYNIFLAKVTNREDIVAGSIIAGRRHADLERIIGMFVNTLALRNYPAGDKTFPGFLQEIKKKTLNAFENQDYQFEDLVEKIVIERDASRNPLFNVMFVLQNIEIPGIEIPGLTILPYEYDNKTAKFDLTLTALEEENKIFFTFEYSTKLFKEETIQRFIVYFKTIVNVVILDKNRRISEFEIQTEEEKSRILFEFNDTKVDYPKDKTVHRLFEEQVERASDRIALVGANLLVCPASSARTARPIQLTYRQLNDQSSRLSGLLIEKGVLSGTIVAIMIERSVEMIIGILGILKSGGAYLPIDPNYPQERINYMLRDSGAAWLAVANGLEGEKVGRWEGGKVLLEEISKSSKNSAYPLMFSPSDFLSPRNLAYVIYTSGTTGKPKGVMVEHRNVIRLVKNTDYILFEDTDRILQSGALEFDASTFEIWGALLNGLTLYVVEKKEILDPGGLKNAIRNYGITIMWMTSPLFDRMLQEDIEIFVGLGNLLVGGDVLSPAYINRLRTKYPQLKVINGYGPTENTTFSTTFPILQEYTANIPVGRPIANSTAYIVDKYNQLQLIGVPGELLVGGDGVARGYLNRPELTAEKFIQDLWDKKDDPDKKSKSFYRGSRGAIFSKKVPLVYKTGDWGRWLGDGNIEFLGRIDQQIKIRGFRIELEEIENRLTGYSAVKEAAVLVRTRGEDKYLCAYIVLKPVEHSLLKVSSFPFTGIKEFLERDLPDYMIPAHFVPLDKIPLTPNGKIDRQALPEPGLQADVNYVAPRDEIEKKLVEIWSDILGKDELHAMQSKTSIGIDDNFFQLGGHSLKAAVLVSKIHKEFDVKIPLVEIFQSPTIKGLSGYIRTAGKVKYAAIEPIEKKEYYEMSHAQVRLWILDRMEKDLVAYNMAGYFQLEKLNRRALERAVETLIKRHEILRTTFITIAGEPKQKVHEYKDLDFTIPYFDLRSAENKDATVNTFLEAEINTPFSLETGPLLRTRLLHVEENRFFVLYTMHHIISDQWSMKIMVKEFKELYGAYDNNMEHTLVPLHIQYKDYTRWHLEQLTGENLKKHQQYWHNRFNGDIPRLELPTDYPRSQLRSYAGEFILFSLSKEITGHLKRICK
ncbi:MAG TPA: amino acid adenylation domain-containing protein, partial [Candidatus Kapabacteria bacterium]|nr:amino acid adenylation domain-containing protein [Candidatus Kapabacteria bacterium]